MPNSKVDSLAVMLLRCARSCTFEANASHALHSPMSDLFHSGSVLQTPQWVRTRPHAWSRLARSISVGAYDVEAAITTIHWSVNSRPRTFVYRCLCFPAYMRRIPSRRRLRAETKHSVYKGMVSSFCSNIDPSCTFLRVRLSSCMFFTYDDLA